jgi:hypothetical protein
MISFDKKYFQSLSFSPDWRGNPFSRERKILEQKAGKWIADKSQAIRFKKLL